MKRRVILSLLLLTAGALVNVAVACWQASDTTGIMRTARGTHWYNSIPHLHQLGLTSDEIRSIAGIDTAHWRGEVTGLEFRRIGATTTEVAVWLQTGYPMRAVFLLKYESPWPRTAHNWCDGRYQEVRPIWPGFAINTMFYAAIFWLLFAAPFGLGGLRNRRRIKRGLCPKCAYDLRGRSPASDSSVCPECGAAVKAIEKR